MSATRHPLFQPYSISPYEPTSEVAALRWLGQILQARGLGKVCDRYGRADSLFRTAKSAYSIWLEAEGAWPKLRAGTHLLLNEARGSSETLLMLLPAPLTLAWQLRDHLVLACLLAVGVLLVLMWIEATRVLNDWFLLSVWPATIVLQVATGESEGLLFSHALAVGIVMAVAGTRPDREVLAETLGIAIPATVLLVLLSLLTPEIWQLATELSLVRVILLGLLLVGPLVVLVYSRITRLSAQLTVDAVDFDDPATQRRLGAQLERTLAGTADARLAQTLSENDTGSSRRPSWSAAELCETALTAARENKRVIAPGFLGVVAPLVRVELRKRFAVVVPAAIAALTLLFYSLAAIAVPVDVSERWSAHPGSSKVVDVVAFELPIAPHPAVALILALAATAIFLGFLLTEEQHVEKLARAVFEEPAHEALLFGLPYAALAPAAIRDLLNAGFLPSFEPKDPPELPLSQYDYVRWRHVDDPYRSLVSNQNFDQAEAKDPAGSRIVGGPPG